MYYFNVVCYFRILKNIYMLLQKNSEFTIMLLCPLWLMLWSWICHTTFKFSFIGFFGFGYFLISDHNTRLHVHVQWHFIYSLSGKSTSSSILTVRGAECSLYPFHNCLDGPYCASCFSSVMSFLYIITLCMLTAVCFFCIEKSALLQWWWITIGFYTHKR